MLKSRALVSHCRRGQLAFIRRLDVRPLLQLQPTTSWPNDLCNHHLRDAGLRRMVSLAETSERPNSTFCEISQDEMESVLFSLEFKQTEVPDGHEFVYERLFEKKNDVSIVVRVFSSIVRGSSRASGTDRIRIVTLRLHADGRTQPLSTKLVNRIQTWSKNVTLKLNAAIKEVDELEQLDKEVKCCKCSNGILEVRMRKDGKNNFLGCSNFPDCRNAVSLGSGPCCPKCSAPMAQRSAKKDPNVKFWGCVQFPDCTEILPLT